MTTITEVINYLKDHISETDITLYPGASADMIYEAERACDIWFPDDVKRFYEFANGFLSEEDQFRIVPLDELEFDGGVCIAEYLTYCDIWKLMINFNDRNNYQIIGYDGAAYNPLTNSFPEFLSRFLKGGVFEKGGLYKWGEEIVATEAGSSRCGRFMIDKNLKITGRGFVVSGQIIEGDISPGDVIIIKDKQIRIIGVEFGHAPKQDWVGLLLKTGTGVELESSIQPLSGTSINIYRSLNNSFNSI